ncbi:MAG TPA: amidohydrolase [Planctomycetota bacterium]
MRPLGLLTIALLTSTTSAQQSAEIVFHGGVVRTLEAARPRASAVAVADGRILFVGSDAEALALAGPETRRVDLRGRALYPGFIDAHGHLEGYAQALLTVDLMGTTSYAQVVERIRERAATLPAGEWVLGRGWDQNDWEIAEFPHHGALSAAVPDHPVAVRRVDGHALLANAEALRRSGIDHDTPDPPGGRVLRDAEGRPTGVLVDRAMGLLNTAGAETGREALRSGVRRAIARLHERGITGIHDAGVGSGTIRLFEEMARAGQFDLRDYVMVSGDPRTLAEWLPRGPVKDLDGGGRIKVRAIKLSADGALGSRGAALLADYADEPGVRGLVTTPRERVEAVARQALAAGFQLCVHAIGDRANREVLDAFEAALRAHPSPDHRFRVEHAQVLAPAEIGRFAQLGVVPSMQAQHQTSDMYWAETRLGPTRVRGAYAWRALLDSGVVIPGGSDFPVEDPDPIAAYRAAVARVDAALWPVGGWYVDQRMRPGEALAHLTLWPAWAAFDEDRLGSIRAGKLADLVVLTHDLVDCPVAELAAVRVEMTVFAGRVVYERGLAER